MILLELFLAGIAAVAIVGMHDLARKRVKKHGVPILAWRWASGLPHHGGELPDGRFWARPRHHRAGRRILRTAAAVVLAWGLLFHGGATLLLIEVCAAGGIAWGIFAVVRWARGRRHHIVWVQPAHLVAAPLVGLPLSAGPSWLTVEPDRSRVVAELPPGYNPDDKQRQRLVQTLTSKLGIEAPETRWALAGPNPRLELTRSEPPPSMVTLADVREAIEAAKPDEVVWGLGKKSAVVKSSLSGDSPHVGISAGSGGGKSVTARSLLAQLLHRGAVAAILDQKMISHHWAANLPNVVVYRRPAEIHAALVWLGAEVQRRNEVALAGADLDGNVHADVGARIIIIAEELNATVDELRGYWRDLGEKGRSPALTAFDKVSFTGRQAMAHIVYIGQSLSAKAMGGGRDSTENMGVVALARYKPRTWKMLASDHAMPPVDLTPGRLQVVSDRVRAAQGIFMTPAEAKAFAVSGVVSPLPYGMPGAPRATGEAVSAIALRTAPEQPNATVSAPGPVLAVSGGVTLSEAHAAGVFGGLTLAGVRTARHRDPLFPGHVGRRGLALEYDPAALADWASARSGGLDQLAVS